MKKLTLVILLILITPLALAFDCSKTSDENYCNTVKESDLNESEKDLLFSSLLYSDNDFPDHEFIETYNKDIIVTQPPENTSVYDSTQIKSAWLSFLAVFPSVHENKTLYVTSSTKALSEYGYYVYVPPNYYSPGYPDTSSGDCKRTYQLVQNEAKVKYYFNDIYRDTGKLVTLPINSDGTIKSQLEINTNLKVDHYHWYSYCCRWYKGSCKKRCHKCKFSHTTYEPDSVKITEEKEVKLYVKKPSVGLTVTNEYYNTTKGVFSADNYSFFRLSFNESQITKQKYYYDLIFDKKPYYLAYLRANNFSHTTQNNIYMDENTFFVKNALNCSLFAFNHFYNTSSECDLTLKQEEVEPLSTKEKNADLSLLLYVLVFLLIIYIIYRLAKSQFKKIVIPILLMLLFIPFVAAAEPPQEEECGITNLASCLPEKMYEYLLYVLNAPLLPLLLAVKKLLTAEVSIDLFQKVWSVIRYILGFFYLFFFIYAGYTFLVSNANPIKRAHAKDLLRNTFLMIILIQGSFYIYDLLLGLSSVLNNTILTMIDPKFFMLTADNLVNIGLQFMMAATYGVVLFLSIIMLTVRYIMVAFGVVLFPIALFCYFIPPLKGYGKFMLEMLGAFIFVTFIDLLIILACSMIVEIPLFANFKIMVMITCFSIVNYTLYLAIKFAIKRSTNVSLKDDLNQAVKYIAMLA